MGSCCPNSSKNQTKIFTNETYSDLDKSIFIANEYMKNNLKQQEIEPFFTSLLFNELIQEKEDKIKQRHFFKWFAMALNSYKNILASIDIEKLLKTIKEKKKNEENSKENIENLSDEIPNLAQEISYCEQGLRNYFTEKHNHFEQRVQKSPPGSFRWIGWIILSGLPIGRTAIYYTNLLTYDLSEKVDNEIMEDIKNTIEEKYTLINEVKCSMYRVLKAMVNVDKDVGYVKGMNFIVAFLLIISNRNEIDTFYFMITLFSKTFSNKFGMRGFYLNEHPLTNVCTEIFQKNLLKFFPEIHEHFQEINFSPLSWISLWMQMAYVNVFPNHILLRVWDYFFIYGLGFLISLGLSITEFLYDDMINIDEPEEIEDFLRLLNPSFITSIKFKDKIINYDIEKLLYNAVKKYLVSNQEIENEVKKSFPLYSNDFIYDYKITKPNMKTKNLNLIRQTMAGNIFHKSFITKKLMTDSDEENENNEKNNNKENNNDTKEKNNNNKENSDDTKEKNSSNSKDDSKSSSGSNSSKSSGSSSDSCDEVDVSDENVGVNTHIEELMRKNESIQK